MKWPSVYISSLSGQPILEEEHIFVSTTTSFHGAPRHINVAHNLALDDERCAGGRAELLLRRLAWASVPATGTAEKANERGLRTYGSKPRGVHSTRQQMYHENSPLSLPAPFQLKNLLGYPPLLFTKHKQSSTRLMPPFISLQLASLPNLSLTPIYPSPHMSIIHARL